MGAACSTAAMLPPWVDAGMHSLSSRSILTVTSAASTSLLLSLPLFRQWLFNLGEEQTLM